MDYDGVCKVLGIHPLVTVSEVWQPIEISLEEAYHGTRRLVPCGKGLQEVSIPRGARTGTKIHVLNAETVGLLARELCLLVVIRPHPIFRRTGDDLHIELPVDFFTAVLGGDVRVPTLTGETSLTIPAGTQPGKTFRLVGWGMPQPNHPQDYGDLLVHAQIRVPADLTDLERRLIEDVAALHGPDGTIHF